MVVITRRFGLSLAAVSVVALVWSTRARAQATTGNTNTTIPFSGVMEECTPEPIAFSGRLHLLTHSTADAADGVHEGLTLNSIRVFGFGLISGARYRLMNVATSHFSEAFEGATVVTGTSQRKVIGQGPAADTTAFLQVHITMNANGEVTADSVHAHGDCP